MTFFSTLALAGAIFLLAITPGPGIFATLSRAMASGFKHAAMLTLGLVIGDIIFLMLAIFGLSAIAHIMGDLFICIKYLGGVYLIWLGFKLFREKPKPITIKGIKELSWTTNLFSGLFITLGNPKVILFYLSFLPTFVDLETLTKTDIITVTFIIFTVIGGVLLSYAYLATKAKKFFKNKKSETRINRIAGFVMMGTGGVLISKT